MDISEVYRIKNEVEVEMCDLLKGFTIATSMAVDGIKVIQIDAKETINVYCKVKVEVKL